MLFKFLALVKKKLILFIFGSIGLGVLIGGYFDTDGLKVLILPLTFALVYPMMVTLNFGSLLDKMNYKLQGFTQIINFIIYPLIAYVIGLIFFRDAAYMRLGLLLIALLPTSGMTISWTVMAKGNINAAIRMVIIGLLFGAILSPFYIEFMLQGTEVSVPVFDILKQIFYVVVVPLGLAILTQYLLVKKYGKKKFHSSIKQKFPPFSTLAVVFIIFVAISLKADIIIANPIVLVEITIPLVIMYFFFIIVSVGTAKIFFNRYDGIALVNGTLIRSLSLALAITLNAFPEAKLTALLIAVGYALQVQIAAWNTKLTNKIFKEDKIEV